jgi:hypothetical protein
MPSPTLKDTVALDKLLDDTVKSRKVPATYFGATTSTGEIYFKGQGERMFGQPEKGEVQEDTSEYRYRCYQIEVAERVSVMQIFSTTKLVTSVRLVMFCAAIQRLTPRSLVISSSTKANYPCTTRTL